MLVITSNFQNSTFEIIAIIVTGIILIQLFFFIVGCRQKNKSENREYHGIFIPLKKWALLKSRESHFSHVWVIEFYIFVFGQSQRFSDNSSLPILINVQRLHENGKFAIFHMVIEEILSPTTFVNTVDTYKRF